MEIVGFPNYTIDRDGTVRNIKKNTVMTAHFNKSIRCMEVGLSYNNKRKIFGVHRLLAICYIPNPNNKPNVEHIDKNRLNNELSNLRWCWNRMGNGVNTWVLHTESAPSSWTGSSHDGEPSAAPEQPSP